MKKKVIGYIFSEEKLTKDERIFIQEAKKKRVELIMFNLLKEFNEKEIESKIKKCDIIYNNSAEEFAFEFIKTAEALGKKVIEPSKNYYYDEDKWIFFLKCKKNKIPTPESILLSENINLARKELKEFSQWPVVLKRIEGTMGEYVEKADNLNEALGIIKKFWKKGSEKLPIIAQEFAPSYCYRIFSIDGKVIQTAVKKGHGWKCTGVYERRNYCFKIDKELKDILKKINKVFKIEICGIDFIKKNKNWLVLEINSAPAFDFFENKRKEVIGKVFNFLIKKIK